MTETESAVEEQDEQIRADQGDDWPPRGHFTIDLSDGFVRIVIPRSGDAAYDAAEIRNAIRTVLAGTGMQPGQVELVRNRIREGILGQPTGLVRPASGQGGGNRPNRPTLNRNRGRGRGQARPEPAEGECNWCQGPVGLVKRSGNMPADKLVCLGQCKDDRNGKTYAHTVRFLGDGEDDDWYGAG